ncbi:RDD family protein [Streptomyces sp. NPDC050523]|uniref:RDD family protein n=1 Tax=Streptomyces sp. NPDC050523 TaxID=3365622 RepID=UPI0037A03466
MGRRLGARLIDAVIFAVVYGILGVAGVAGALGSTKECRPNTANYSTCVGNAGSSFMFTFGAVAGFLVLVGLLYEWLMVGMTGRTLGKMAVGLRVVNVETGGKPGLGKSFVRWIIPTVGSIVCGIGQLVVYLSPFWDKSGRQQGWHDKAAGTMVIQY